MADEPVAHVDSESDFQFHVNALNVQRNHDLAACRALDCKQKKIAAS
jgi:hypothetical protein